MDNEKLTNLINSPAIDYSKNALDVFRIIATVQVFLGHIITHFDMQSPPTSAIYFVRGVPILFALCGFLAAKSLEKYSTKKWLLNRAVRILPAFWVCILLNTLIILFVYNQKPTLWEGLVYFMTQFLGLNFYTGDWLRNYGVGVPNGVLWTISAQIQFFILAPLFQKFLKNKSVTVGLGSIGILTFASILCNRLSSLLPSIAVKLLNVTVIPYLYFLVAGMLVWYHREQIIPFLKKYKWFFITVYVLWKIAELFSFVSLADGVLYNTVTTLILLCVIFGFSFSYCWRLPRDFTYGFYLYHMVFINLCIEFSFKSLVPAWQGILVLVIIIALTVTASILSQQFIEIPIAKLVKKGGTRHG